MIDAPHDVMVAHRADLHALAGVALRDGHTDAMACSRYRRAFARWVAFPMLARAAAAAAWQRAHGECPGAQNCGGTL